MSSKGSKGVFTIPLKENALVNMMCQATVLDLELGHNVAYRCTSWFTFSILNFRHTTNISDNAKDIENIELFLRSFEKINIGVPALFF
jgi:hypothetical protein